MAATAHEARPRYEPLAGNGDAIQTMVAEVEARLEAVEGLEPGARRVAGEAVRGLARVYGEGLARMVARLRQWEEDGEGTGGQGPLDLLLEDELIVHLLILHDLHPIDLAGRVELAIEEAAGELGGEGGGLELVGIEDGIVQIRTVAWSREQRISARRLQEVVSSWIRRFAPEMEEVEIVPGPALVQLGIRRG